MRSCGQILWSIFCNSVGNPPHAFLFRTNLKLHIYITLKIDQKFISDFDSSKVSGFYCNQVVFLRNCETKLSYILGGFSDFQYDFWSSRSTTDILKVLADRLVTTFNISGATGCIKGFLRGLSCWSYLQTEVLS